RSAAGRRLLPPAPGVRTGYTRLDQVLPTGGADRGRRRPGRGALGRLARPGSAGPPRGGTPMGAGMATRLTESASYAHLWRTPALAEVFEEPCRLRARLDPPPPPAAPSTPTWWPPRRGGPPTRPSASSRPCAACSPNRPASTCTTAPPSRTSPTPGSGW